MDDTPPQSSDHLDEVIAEYLAAEESGAAPPRDEVVAANPELAEELRRFFANREELAVALPGVSPRQHFVPPKVRYFGDYELLDEIARGGMGVVYRAKQTSLNRIVAIKMILAGHLAGEEDVKRFRTEAEAAANLQHPGIVPVHEVGVHEGQHYFSMDFIEGRSLSQLVRENPLPGRKAAEYVKSIAEAVQYAHQQGTLHRDLKPSNILIDTEDRVHVTDFGLAVRVEGDSELTRTGDIIGTPAYMPPEQAQAKRGLIGPASDVYSMGVILYELLTGRPPFKAESSVETLRQVIETEPVSLRRLNPRLPRDLETICLKCLRKVPERRYGTAAGLAEDLACWLNNEPVRARPVGRLEKLRLWCVRRPGIAGLLALLLIVLVLAGAAGFVGHRRMRARALVDQLLSAEITHVPGIIDDLVPYRNRAVPLLQSSYAAADRADDSRGQLHSALALHALVGDGRDLDELHERLLASSPTEFPIICDALTDRRPQLIGPLWSLALNSESDSDRRFRACCALARYTPEDDHWAAIAPFVADELVSVSPTDLGPWREQLAPVKVQLIGPLHEIFQNPDEWEQMRSFAADSLAAYLADDVDALYALLMESGEQQFGVLIPSLAALRPQFVRLLQAELESPLDESASEDVKEESGRRRAYAAMAFYEIDRPALAAPVLRHSPDPRARTCFIHWAAKFGVEVRQIIGQLRQAADPSVRSAQVLSLDQFNARQLPEADRERLASELLAIYRDDPDPGLHAATRWLLTRWGRAAELDDIDHQLRVSAIQWGNEDAGTARWFVNTQGYTMVIVVADSFFMGMPDSVAFDPAPNELRTRVRPRHRVRIGRTFAIASTEVNRRQWDRFLQAQTSAPTTPESENTRAESERARNGLTWYQAAEYCNWLSQQEGIPEDQWCYIPNARGEYASGMRPAPDFLMRIGYRLPTEAEWEFSCRAGTITSRHFGEADRFLPYYAACRENSSFRTWPVATFKPNDLGLFDMLGNVTEWCQDRGEFYPEAPGEYLDRPQADPVTNQIGRVLRGGNFEVVLNRIDAADRKWYMPSLPWDEFGFRVARTIVPAAQDAPTPEELAFHETAQANDQWERAQQLGQQGKWREAVELMRLSLESLPNHPQRWFDVHQVLLFLGDIDGVNANCDRMLQRFGSTDLPEVAHIVASASLQVPNREVTETIQRLVDLSLSSSNLVHPRDAGLLHLRRGEYTEAGQWLRKASGSNVWNYGRLYSLYYLALNQQQLGDHAGAQASLREAHEVRTAIEAGFAEDEYGPRWTVWLGTEAVRREVEQVVSLDDDLGSDEQ